MFGPFSDTDTQGEAMSDPEICVHGIPSDEACLQFRMDEQAQIAIEARYEAEIPAQGECCGCGVATNYELVFCDKCGDGFCKGCIEDHTCQETVGTPSAFLMNEIYAAEAQLRTVQNSLCDALVQMARAKSCVRALEKDRDAAVAELQDVIRQRQLRLPLQAPDPTATAKPKPAEEEQDDSEQEYLSTPVNMLDIPPTLQQLLIDRGFPTVKHIAEWTKQDKLLTEIKGVGDNKAEKIEAALVKLAEDMRAQK